MVTCSFGQSFGLQVGANLGSATIKEDQSGFSISPKSEFGFLVGAVAEIPVSTSISFRPELNFIKKGFKLSLSDNSGGFSYSNESDATMNYLEMPLNYVYNFPVGANHVFLGAGPSFGYGLSGKAKQKKVEQGFQRLKRKTILISVAMKMMTTLNRWTLVPIYLEDLK